LILLTYPKSERSKVQFQMNLKSALVLCAALRHALATTGYRNDQIASHTIAPQVTTAQWRVAGQ
jgi:hypothetical protein